MDWWLRADKSISRRNFNSQWIYAVTDSAIAVKIHAEQYWDVVEIAQNEKILVTADDVVGCSSHSTGEKFVIGAIPAYTDDIIFNINDFAKRKSGQIENNWYGVPRFQISVD